MYFGVLLLTVALLSPSFCYKHRRFHDRSNIHQGQEEIDVGIGKFGINLFKSLINQNFEQDQNVLISPMSVYFSLALTHLGASGNTRDEIRNVMGLPADEEWVLKSHQNLAELFRRLQHSENVNVTINNGLFLQNGLKFKDLFTSQIKQFYDCKAVQIDFMQQNSVDQINQWFDTVTNGKIKQFYDHAISTDTKLLLANTMVFNGEWDRAFPEDYTKTEHFQCEDGQEERVMMIRKNDHIPYYNNPNGKFEVVGIPYRNKEYIMYVILPNESQNLKNVADLLSQEQIEQIIRGSTTRTIDLKMPQIKITNRNQMKDALQLMGIRKLFKSPDLSNMLENEMGLKVAQILNQVEMEVTEQGTDISAGFVQEYKMYSEFIPNDDVKQFYVNRPFMFFIHHPYTKSVIFYGSILKVSNVN